MSRFLLLCLILADVFVVLAMRSTTKSPSMYSFANAPSSSANGVAEAPTIRKLGKHGKEVFKLVDASSGLIPAHAPSADGIFQAKGIHLENHHHNMDKSIAGGGVILGGLATTFLVALFCYIRATRRKGLQPSV